MESENVRLTMRFDDLTALLAANQSGNDGCYQELYDGITLGKVKPLSTEPGKARARTLLGTWKIREWTTRRSGIARLGFEATLRNLASRQADEQLVVWGLDSSEKVYVVFVAEADEAGAVKRDLVGCIRVTTKRRRTPLEVLTDLKPTRR